MTLTKRYSISIKKILILYSVIGVCFCVSVITFLDSVSTNSTLTQESRAVGLLSDALSDVCQDENVNNKYSHECNLALDYISNEQPNKILCNSDGTTTFIYATGNKRTFRAKCSIPE